MLSKSKKLDSKGSDFLFLCNIGFPFLEQIWHFCIPYNFIINQKLNLTFIYDYHLLQYSPNCNNYQFKNKYQNFNI
jgi:hypothetical protein